MVIGVDDVGGGGIVAIIVVFVHFVLVTVFAVMVVSLL